MKLKKLRRKVFRGIDSRIYYFVRRRLAKIWTKIWTKTWIKIRYERLYNHIMNDSWGGKERYKDELKYLHDNNREYIKKYGEPIGIPYKFREQYIEKKQDILIDENGLYIVQKGKRLYFPLEWTGESAAVKYSSLESEQDIDSPHRYFVDGFYPNDEDIFIDIGAAEGKEALEVVDTCKELYLFEAEATWNECLKNTFSPYQEKVFIRNCFIGAENDAAKNIRSLDTEFSNLYNQKIFIKVDVEGMEMEVLKGAKHLLANNKVRLLVCTYHKQNDGEEISSWLTRQGFKNEFSKGYVIFFYDKEIKPPYFRHGLIRSKNF